MNLSEIPTEALVLELQRRGIRITASRALRTVEKVELTHAALLRELMYDEESGNFYSRRRYSQDGTPQRVGHIKPKGYGVVSASGWPYAAHRLAWFYVHGQWPEHEVDHINGNKTDNRICNLREVTKKQNQENRKNFNGKSGVRGVCWAESAGKWKAYIRHNKKLYNLGLFDSKEEAGAAAKAARDRLFTHHMN